MSGTFVQADELFNYITTGLNVNTDYVVNYDPTLLQNENKFKLLFTEHSLI